MQVGFLLLEGGRVRAKNSVNVAQKNISDLIVTWTLFFALGFFLMFGVAVPSTGDSSPTPLQFLFQLGFCATAASIVSGGVAERMSYRAYLAVVVVASGLLYPLMGWLAWGNMFAETRLAPLADIGFVDFSGSSVVHSLGGWIALGAILTIGARHQRFDEDGQPAPIPASSPVMSMQGALLLMLGWLGFNGGSVSVSDPLLQGIILNTVIAGFMGSLGGMLLGTVVDKGIANPNRMINGLIGGLVSCTAAIHLMSSTSAAVVGFAGGCLAVWASQMLLVRFKLDDPVDVVATHGIAGVFGTLCVAFVGPVSLLPTGSRIVQLGVQLLGAVTIFVLTLGGIMLALRVISRFTKLRVTTEQERIGLNYTEHGIALGSSRLQNALVENIEAINANLEVQPEQHSDEPGTEVLQSTLIKIENDDENAELAQTINRVLTINEGIRKKIETESIRFHDFADAASDWLWETNEELTFTFVGDSDGFVEAELSPASVGESLFDILQFTESNRTELMSAVKQQQKFSDISATLPLLADDRVVLHVLIRGVPYNNDDGTFGGYRGSVSDITQRKAAETRATFLAMHDELTGLPNRRALSDTMEQQIRKAGLNKTVFAIAGVDLDGFKAVNDTYGHAIGDALLKQVAARIEQHLASDEVVCRTGGDEFVIVLAGLSSQYAREHTTAVCQRIIDDLASEYSIEVLKIRIGASIGLSFYPEHSTSSQELAHQADMALYEAKNRGKGQVVIFEPCMDKDAQTLSDMENDLVRALAEKEFYLLFQPIYDTNSLEIGGFESLIRWAHPERGEISPAGFISLAEKLDKMNDIFFYVLENTCENAKRYLSINKALPATFAINLSVSQLHEPELCKRILQILDKHGVMPANLELELTSTVLMEAGNKSVGIMKEIRDAGITISLDDFGSDNDRPENLRQFPINKLKLDQRLISSMLNDQKTAKKLKVLNSIGQSMNLSIVAQGVETAEQHDALIKLGCNQLQGFYYSAPLRDHELDPEQGGPDRKAA